MRPGRREGQWQSVGLLALFLVFLSVSFAGAEDDRRKAVFAGLFYPADKAQLQAVVEGYLTETAGTRGVPSDRLLGIIVPHAGYDYSGRIAAYGYNLLKGRAYRTVILIGASHQAAFTGAVVYPSGKWETPLGSVPIDDDLARFLARGPEPLHLDTNVFQQEHSLEVQLPFLQSVLGSFRILPVLMGQMDTKGMKRLADLLVRAVNRDPDGTVIVVSTDMSHFHRYAEAVEMDRASMKTIGAMKIEELVAGIEKGTYELCGAPAVIPSLMAARKLGGEPAILAYGTSADRTNDRTRVVGYFSAVLTVPGDRSDLNESQKQELLLFARKTIEASVDGRPLPSFDPRDKVLREKRGLFVTVRKKGELRGCIGYIEGVKPLVTALSDMAVAASSRDPRFPPVRKDEVKDLRIEISVLSPLKPVSDLSAIDVGRHGLVVVQGGRSGLLLPQVAVENGWNRDEFLSQACRKSGLSPRCWKEKETEIFLFSAQIFSE